MEGKRGQFFILAAVIMSVVIVSLVTTKNYVQVSKEPKNFYDWGYGIHDESLKVIDYGTYNQDDKLPDFATEIGDEAVASGYEIVILEGNESNARLRNLADLDLSVRENGKWVNVTGGRKESESKVCLPDACNEVSQRISDYSQNSSIKVISNQNNVTVKFYGKKYKFSLGKNKRFYMILQKKIGDEVYIYSK